MEIISELKKVWLGIVLGYISIPVWTAISEGASFARFVDELFDSEMFILYAWMALTVLSVWIGRICWKALIKEGNDISSYIKNRGKEVTTE